MKSMAKVGKVAAVLRLGSLSEVDGQCAEGQAKLKLPAWLIPAHPCSDLATN